MSLRAWVLRRAMGRLRITDDIVRYLSTFQRLGETVEVELPGELVPVGARTVFRAIRTRAAAQLGIDWIWPQWLERQLDPASPAFIPRGHLPVLTNVTNRNWTMVGNVGSRREAIVAPGGLVTPWYDGWSLDWWVEADDGWHFPSRERDVRQGLVGSSPVVETRMALPGGDVAQRVYAAGVGDEELAVVETANRTPSPVTVALAVRPYNPEGLAVVERIGLVDGAVTVDGRPALLFPEAPVGMAGSTFLEGDVAHAVGDGRTATVLPSPLRCEAGLAQAAFLFQLGTGAVLRAAIPLAAQRRTRRRGLARRRVERMPELPPTLPTSDDVARWWAEADDAAGMRLVVPEGRLAEAVEANRRYLLLFNDGDEITPGPFTYHRFWFRDAAYMLAALNRYGLHAEAAEILRSYPRRQHVDGFFFSQRQEWDANGAALWAVAEHWRLARDRELVKLLAPSVRRGVRWIERKRRSKRRKDAALRGLMPASISAEHLGPFDYYYWDSFWSLRGLLDGAELLDVAGDADAAAGARRWAAGLEADLRASLELVARRLSLGRPVMPAGPRRRVDPGLIGSLVACYPLGLRDARDPAVAATADVVRERFCIDRAFFQSISHTGLGTYLTLQLAFVELDAGDRRALDRLRWMVEVATPTHTWPEAIHPRLGGGCMGDGHHGWAAADFLSFVRCLLVREVDGGLALCSMLPDDWHGRDLEVHRAPTHAGALTFSLRWHAGRPTLRWDLRTHDGMGPVRLTAPGLDPTWSSVEAKGEAVLAATAAV